MTEDEILQMMEAETWLTAEDAVAYGLIDRVSGTAETGPAPLVAAASAFGLADPKAIEEWRRQQAERRTAAQEAAQARYDYLRLMEV